MYMVIYVNTMVICGNKCKYYDIHICVSAIVAYGYIFICMYICKNTMVIYRSIIICIDMYTLQIPSHQYVYIYITINIYILILWL